MTTRPTGLSAPGPAAEFEDVPAEHGLVIAERDLH